MLSCNKYPALADVHVHFREPGYSHKETISTGCDAAVAGGYTAVCPMPNLDPVPDSLSGLQSELSIIQRDATIFVHPFASITIGRKGLQLVDVKTLAPLCAGFSDDGSGVQDEDVMFAAMKQVASQGSIISAHCEDRTLVGGGCIHAGKYASEHNLPGISSESEWVQIERDLDMARITGCRYHVCHVSTKEGVQAVRKAKAMGVDVSCETAPHYLLLTEDDLQDEGRFKMNPPLRTREDRSALIEGILDGTVDMIATDHAPHTAQEKSLGLEKSAMGIVGLETAFPLLYTYFVRGGVFTLDRLFELMCFNPRKRFSLPDGKDDYICLDLDTPFVVDSSRFRSKGRSTPFDGRELYGRCTRTVYRGREVFREVKL